MSKTNERELRDFIQTMFHAETKTFVVRNPWWESHTRVVACRRESHVWILADGIDPMPIRFETTMWIRSVEDARKVVDEWINATADDDAKEARHVG
ncbi:MAG: hypothetical protein ACHREM_06340 [Polyangiales bacterium]